MTLVKQNELIWSAEKSANTNLDYIVMIVLSALSVQLTVQSDHEIRPEEVEAAQFLIDELYRQNVDLRQIARPLAPVVAQVSEILRGAFPSASISDVMVAATDGLLVGAILQDFEPPAPEQLEEAKRLISRAMDDEVRLELAFQHLLAASS